MSVLYLLIPIGLMILILSIKLLFWAINNGQYDDLDMEGHRILFDDAAEPSKNKLVEKTVSNDQNCQSKEPKKTMYNEELFNEKASKDKLPKDTS
jgi:cbb3-type cytochrome oxidase maturation protein